MDIYLIGICGTGVGALAGLLKAQHHQVRGSDQNIYPPMSLKLEQWGIPVLLGFKAEHLSQKHPDLVIVGNVASANNPEAVYARENGIRTLSMPQAIAEFGIQDKHSIVIAGTHGKTTITALTSHMLMHAGQDPGYLVGGALVQYPDSFHSGTGNYFVIEGDEYDTAYFDKRSKFVHYKAQTALITSLEFDHADIFSSIEAVEKAFQSLIETVPAHGRFVVWAGAHRARKLIEQYRTTQELIVYDTQRGPGVNLWLEHYTSTPNGLEFQAATPHQTYEPMRVQLWGNFSANNVLAVMGVLQHAQLTEQQLKDGFASFQGVRRRMEVRGTPGQRIVVDDFAHHPTAVRVTLDAARTRWPHQKIWAIFEPRSATSRRNVFQQDYVHSFNSADAVIISTHERLSEIHAEQRFDPQQLVHDLNQAHKPAYFFETSDHIVQYLQQHSQPGDVFMVLSNGDFQQLHLKLLNAFP